MSFVARIALALAHHLAGAQPAAVAETEHHASPEAVGNRQQALGLIHAYHLLRLAQVINLGGKVEAPQRHAE